MRRRFVVLLSVLVSSVMVVAISAGPAAAATPTPTVRALSSTSGPLAARTLTLYGRHLGSVSRVRFGASVGSRLRHQGSTKLTVVTPRGRRTSAVTVQIYSSRRWRSVARYTFVARPTLTRLSRASVPVTGQTAVTVSGRDLGYVSSVTIGGAAARVTRRSTGSLVVLAPPAPAGAYAVSASSVGGTGTASARLTYVLPAAADTASFTAAPSTVTAAGVLWVSGDPSAVASATTDPAWVVAVAPGGTLPQVGDRYFLRPGGSVFPAGFAGTVTSIAAQQDGSTRLTVAPVALDQALTTATIRYADSPDPSAKPARSRRPAASGEGSQASSLSFPHLGPNVFACHSKDGNTVTFSGEVGLRFDRFNRSFSANLGAHPSIDGFITGSLVSYGKVSVEASMTCDLKPSWADANRKVIPLGEGATLSFGPAAEIKITGSGTVSFEQTTRFMYGLSKTGDQPVQYYRIAKQEGVESTGSAAMAVEISAGMSVQIGILDRVGIEIKAQLYAAGSLSLRTGPPQVCVDLGLGLKLSVGAFLDLWVVRWDATALQVKIEFAALHKCSAPSSAADPTTSPQITSDVLPAAQVGIDYQTQLSTADDRLGHWTLVSGSLPAGLTLSADGMLSGTPQSGVGTRQLMVRFVDTSARSDDANLLLSVAPDSGLGGGDIQATLTWNSTADLDLHGVGPDGEEIYYGSPGPTDTNGELDHDANAGCATVDPSPTENIHWPSEDAAGGEYDFAVVTFDGCDDPDLSWHLVVRVRGVVVIDETGAGDSEWFSLQYTSATGAARVVRHVVGHGRPAPVHGPAK